jgi:hypothetical protein
MSSSAAKQRWWWGSSSEALEILRRVVTECTEGCQVVPMLLGTIHGVVDGEHTKCR